MANLLALFAPPNVINELLQRLSLSPETINYVVWPFIQIGAVVTAVAVWAAYATYLERKISARGTPCGRPSSLWCLGYSGQTSRL